MSAALIRSASQAGLRVPRFICVATGSALLGATLLTLTLLIRDRPIPGAAWFLLPAIPILVLGQVWAITSSIRDSRAATKSQGWLSRMTRAATPPWFKGLPRPLGGAVVALAAVGVLSAVGAIPGISGGNPERGPASCPYRLDNHGVITCVNHARYVRAQVASERFFTGVFTGFYAMQFGLAAAVVGRSRRRVQPSSDSQSL